MSIVFKDIMACFLQIPDIVPVPHLIQSYSFLGSIILILLNFDSTSRSFPSVCGHVLEWSPGWSVSRVSRGQIALATSEFSMGSMHSSTNRIRPNSSSLISCSQIDSTQFLLIILGFFCFGVCLMSCCFLCFLSHRC